MSTASALGLTALAMIGCGSSASGTLSNADFVRQGNQICAAVNSQVAALPAVKVLGDIGADGSKELGYVKGALAKLRALKPPAADQTVFSQYLTNVEQEAALVSRLVTAANAGNATQIKAIASAGQVSSQQVHAQATRLGLLQCAKNVNEGSAHKP